MHAKTKKATTKLTTGIALVIVLSFCLCVTTFALAYATITVENNLFTTATMQINLNDGKPVIEENEFLFEPGMTVKKDFFLENQSSIEVYYKIYFEDLEGGLANFLQVTIKAGDEVLYDGTARNLTRDKVEAAKNTLPAGKKQDMEIYFYFPPEIGNAAQGLDLSFKLAADAVQTQNNPFKRFE
jgi:hypothetical protein